MTKTLVTGAAGFTGRYLAQLLASRGHEVHGIVHQELAEPVAGVTRLHTADLANRSAVAKVVADVAPDHVVHLAAIAFIAHGDVDEMYRTNVVGTRQLLDVLAASKAKPRSVIVASSANIYGNSRGGVFDESTLPAPANDYGVSKVAAELVAKLYQNSLPLIVTRPFNYTGRGQAENFLIPKIVAHARRKAPLIELGNLDVARDFSDVRSVADAYARLLETPKAIGGTFNICSGRAVSLDEVVQLVVTLSGHQMEVRVNPAFVRADEVKTLSGSAARLKSVVGNFDEIALPETLRWMLDAE
jgi:nucleoside-diphosphate-sugar epimerase